ncbi:epidermal growth factor receptor [Enhygromyxa salina]|uniref:Epidermal growth factor receptor n=1 Tax=Enhygromyxa salina TaxID=215803 RepID=A0A0C2CVR7_9BACT|nr:hypothetical protein [Enhygromyxa salina]KIG13695.1 epidermal growth factor receptor [Enhygromyxa salina]
MTLDDFLSALENLIEDRESSDDEPGVGNFSCEDCRACNHCRFCIGCDTCEDCTYCEECLDCTSGTQCKRCVGCEKVSYCDDSRDCKESRYLTLCVSCTDCVHCLACVGLTGAEFYVLNEKRTRKEYFALLRQVQELMQTRMEAGWRPPGIGLASEIIDAVTASRDPLLSAAPWLGEGRGDVGAVEEDLFLDSGEPPLGVDELEREPDFSNSGSDSRSDSGSGLGSDLGSGPGFGSGAGFGREPAPDDREQASPGSRERFDVGRERPGRGGYVQEDRPRPAGRGEYGRPTRDDYARDDYARDDYAPRDHAPRYTDDQEGRDDTGSSDWAREPPEFGSSYFNARSEDPQRARDTREPGRGELGRSRPRTDYGEDLGRDLSVDLDAPDVPHRQDQQPTQPFTRRAEPEPLEAAVWDDAHAPREPHREDTRERTAARRRDLDRDHREPADESPWEDRSGHNQTSSGQANRRGSLRQAGRPKRPPEHPGPREVTGTGSYRTGSAPERGGTGTGTNTGGTGLRLGRKPKRRR